MSLSFLFLKRNYNERLKRFSSSSKAFEQNDEVTVEVFGASDKDFSRRERILFGNKE